MRLQPRIGPTPLSDSERMRRGDEGGCPHPGTLSSPRLPLQLSLSLPDSFQPLFRCKVSHYHSNKIRGGPLSMRRGLIGGAGGEGRKWGGGSGGSGVGVEIHFSFSFP